MNERLTAIVLIVLALAVVFIMFNPFGWFEPPEQPLIEVDAGQAELLRTEMEALPELSPQEAFSALFSRFPVVIAGELEGVGQEVRYIRELLPSLPSMGVRILAMEHILEADQNELDRLLSAETFDEYLAQELLFRRQVTWGYQEYVDILKTAWQINMGPDGPFRVLGLNVLQDYRHIQSVEDFRDPVKLRQIMANGVPDAHMAGVISREILANGSQALILVGREQSFTNFLLKTHSEEMNAIGMAEQRQMGKILSDAHGERFATVLFHSPWPTTLTNSRAQFPVNGLIDRVLDDWEGDGSPRPYPLHIPVEMLEESSGIPIRFTNYAIGYNNERENNETLVFEDMADLYVILGRIPDLDGLTPIENFIDSAREARAVENFPGSRYQDADADDVNDFIRRYAEDRKALLNGFAD